MKKLVSLLFVLVFTSACIPTDDEVDDGPSGIITPQEGNIVINIEIELPSDAKLTPSDLIVSSIFSDESQQTSGNTAVEIIDNDGLELTFATDRDDNIVLLGFVNPKDPVSHKMNSTTTAQVLLLMHPWAMDLTTELKLQLIEEVLSMPEYELLRNEIESEISSENVDLFNNQALLVSLVDLMDAVVSNDDIEKQANTAKKIDEVKKPLSINANGNVLTVTNIDNSMAYGIKLLGADGSSEIKALPDVDKNLFALDQIGRIVTLQGFRPTEQSFDITNNQEYSIIAKNGLLFDGSAENNIVRSKNAGKIVLSLLGIISSSIKDAFSNDECLNALGQFAFGNVSDVFKSLSENQISSEDFLSKMTIFLLNKAKDAEGVLEKCGQPLIKSERLKTILKAMVKIEEVFNGAEFGLLVLDWVRYPNQIEFCLDKSSGDALRCDAISISGDLIFNRIPIGKPQSRVITIRNNTANLFKILEFNFPKEDFKSEPEIPTDGSGIDLEKGSSLEFTITFHPESEDDFSGIFEVITDLSENGKATVEVDAKGVFPLKSDATELDFGNIAVDESSETKTITLTNESDVEIVLSEVPPIEGYTFDTSSGEETSIPEQSIAPDDTVSIGVKFKPTSEFEDYNKSISFKTDTDQEDIIVNLRGDGIKGLVLEVLSTPNNLDFGKVDINSETGERKSLRLSNPTDISLDINGFIFTQEADGGSYTTSLDNELDNPSGITLASGESREFTITFKPDEIRSYNGEFVVDNTGSPNEPIRIPILGEGVSKELSVDPDFLDFGEVEVGSAPSTRTFTITNNLGETTTLNIQSNRPEITTDWINGTELANGQSRTVTVQFNPDSSTTDNIIKGTIEIKNTNLDELAKVNYEAKKKENNLNILEGNWLPEWTVLTCEPTPTSNDTQCINHQNPRPYIFIPLANANCAGEVCGIMDFNNIRNGNSDTQVINEWSYDDNDNSVTINIRSRSNGFFFTDRTFIFNGTYNEGANTIIGSYESEYIGGGSAGWKNKATGTLTLRKEQ